MASDTFGNIFRILVATDNHLGCHEKDAERSEDSFETFEEILALAVEHKVDFILLGGDLFHENKPSQPCVIRCMELLRKYTFGDRSVAFDFVSDPADNFPHMKNPIVNYKDPNLNVAIPVFSIHGNHDDPTGLGQQCALELLSSSGMVNYIGRINDLKEVRLSPILLEKGASKLAIYGLSSIKDERLFRLFKNDKVTMLCPKESTDEWFKIMVLHQNHVAHSMTNYIPEEFLPTMLDLVIWGHEHESLINPRRSTGNDEDTFHVMQPGSSVVTSLCPGEAVPKNVALLEVFEKKFKVTPLPLQTIRPFVFEDLILSESDLSEVDILCAEAVEKLAAEKVQKMLVDAIRLLTGHPKQPKKPLLRLRLVYTDQRQTFNVFRFGHQFADQVANPEEMILFKKVTQSCGKIKAGGNFDAATMESAFDINAQNVRVEDLVEQYFTELEDDRLRLNLLTEKGMGKAVTAFVEKELNSAISTIFNSQVEKTEKYLMHKYETEGLREERIDDAIIGFRQHRFTNLAKEEEEEVATSLNRSQNGSHNVTMAADSPEETSDNDLDVDEREPPVRGARGGRTRGSQRSRARNTGAAVSRSGHEVVESPPTGRSRGRGSRGPRGPRAAARGVTQTQNQTTLNFSRATPRTSASKAGRRGVNYDSDDDYF